MAKIICYGEEARKALEAKEGEQNHGNDKESNS